MFEGGEGRAERRELHLSGEPSKEESRDMAYGVNNFMDIIEATAIKGKESGVDKAKWTLTWSWGARERRCRLREPQSGMERRVLHRSGRELCVPHPSGERGKTKHSHFVIRPSCPRAMRFLGFLDGTNFKEESYMTRRRRRLASRSTS